MRPYNEHQRSVAAVWSVEGLTAVSERAAGGLPLVSRGARWDRMRLGLSRVLLRLDDGLYAVVSWSQLDQQKTSNSPWAKSDPCSVRRVAFSGTEMGQI